MNQSEICVFAIDIGETHSCVLYSLTHCPEKIEKITKWEGCDRLMTKVPTVVLFDKKKEFHSFGFEAINHFNDLRNDEEKKRWYLFEGFHKWTNNYMQAETELPDKNGKKLETCKVYGSIIKFFIDRMHTLFHCQDLPVYQTDFHIVITVPTICTKSYKSMLQNAFLCTGYKYEYSFIRETEAILNYWKYRGSEERGLPEPIDLNNTNGLLLVNLRGRTATITAVDVLHGIPRRVHNVKGGGWGGQAVNEEFKQFLIKVVGAPVFMKFVEEEESDWIDLQQKFEVIKHAMKKEDEGKVTLKMPVSLLNMLEYDCEESLEAAVQASPYSKEITFIGDKMRLHVRIIKDLFNNSVEKIVSNIKDALQNKAVKGTKNIIMVGGFSNSPLVQDAVKKAFPAYNVLVPREPHLTIFQGAIITRHHVKPPKTKVNTVSKFTYGVKVSHINDEHGCSEVERDETKIFVRKGDTVSEGDKVTWELTLETCDMQHAEIQFFKSPRMETVSADENGIDYLKQLSIDFDGLHTKNVEIAMLFNPLYFAREEMHPEQNVYIGDL